VQGRVLNPSVVSPPTGTETMLEVQNHTKLDDDGDNNNDNNIFKYGLIDNDDKF